MINVYIPRDTASLSMGADDVAAAIEALPEEINIIRNGTWGMTFLEPLVEVKTDQGRVAYGPVTAADVRGLYEAGFLKGADHELCHGLTSEINYLKNQDRLTFARCGLTDPLSLSQYIDNDGYNGLSNALKLSSKEIVEEVTTSGLRGRGGAAFPTGIKWNTVLETEGTQKYICCNADEGDSGTFSDRILMECDPFCLIEGMTIAGIAAQATKGYIYLRSEYPLCKVVLNEAINIARRENYLGDDICGSGKAFDIEVRIGAGSYVCGEETAMLESLEGKRGMIRAKPPLPAHVGLFGKPTIINNVLSLASVPIIMDKGGEYYKDFGIGRSRGTIAFQLTGNIKCGGLVEKAFGITLGELISEYGQGTYSGNEIKAVQVGGPLGAYLAERSFDLPLDYEAFSEVGAVLGHGGIVVFDETANMKDQAKFAFDFCAIESCGKCTPCRIGSTRGAELIEAGNFELTEELCELMDTSSLCAMGGMTPIPVKSALKNWPEDFEK
ncbi:MAG: formate dehydrogenase [Kordiimonadaceae bacterium]|mgnify:CR=1 FL=1|jgi:formate dehydrogenase iron-sulfur subunit|nr:formate dehydrogenase [Kordiimonadaceae bacterium]MBT6329039.1 formate dehydrogenase [Kordiimonadaceae bacterium]MBT7582067.1 formate dehydrogenase [Kordiimonadaceae bacterium]